MLNMKINVGNPPPEIEIKEEGLISAKYTALGIQRYKQTIESYSEQLFNKATLLGDLDKVKGYDCEVTEHHVRIATMEIEKYFGKVKKPNWVIFNQAGEYLCTGIAGAGASNLNQNWGILTFGFSLVIGIALFVNRMIRNN